jgi:phosphate transport system substrate-binding protein
MELRIFAAAIAANMAAVSAAIALDQSLPAYQVVPAVSGQLKSVGSDTLNIEMTTWAKSFEDLYPAVNIEIESKGSATAPPALLQGTSQFAPMSRPMTAEDRRFEKKYGYKASASQSTH